MFDSSQPPLLVMPITMRQIHLFPPHEGYSVHIFSEDQTLVSYRDGWLFPLTVQQQRFITAPPLFLVKNSGGITTAGSTFNKGYAHQFCQKNGQEPVCLSQQAVFPDQPNTDWMLIPNNVTMIWLQYGNKNQYCGGSSFEMERIYYGKLLIREFAIEEDFAPAFGKHAADSTTTAKQYRVSSHQLYNGSWNLTNEDTEEYLKTLLTSENLDRFQPAVTTALNRASTQEQTV